MESLWTTATLCENVHISCLEISRFHWTRRGDKSNEETRISSIGEDKYMNEEEGGGPGDHYPWIEVDQVRATAMAMTGQYVKPLSSLVLSLRSPCRPGFFLTSSPSTARPDKLTNYARCCVRQCDYVSISNNILCVERSNGTSVEFLSHR